MYLRWLKRPFDIFITACLGILFSWLFVLIAIVFVITFKFPIFYMQRRIGRGNVPFTLYKFRTLHTDENLPLQVRRFWWGDVLRFLSLDEMPQLWNILKGEMSFIGPRPLPTEYLSLMNEQQRSRHLLRPGITGLTQVRGRHQIRWEEKFRLDEYYVDHVSFKLDVFILFKTILLLLTPRKDVSLLEEKFKGN